MVRAYYECAVRYRWWLIGALATLFVLLAGFEASIFTDQISSQCKKADQSGKEYCPGYAVAFAFAGRLVDVLRPYENLITALSGATVAIFTFTLWLTTRQMWRASVSQIEVANKTVESMVNAERARLYVIATADMVVSKLKQAAAYDHPTSGDMRINNLGPIYLSFKNFGKTPGFIQEIGYETMVEDFLPKEKQYTLLVPMLVDEVLDGGEKTQPIRIPAPQMRAADAVAIQNFDKTLWLYGYITYGDAFGDTYTLDFVWHYAVNSAGFRSYEFRETKHARQEGRTG
jgi:hypothetical protein